MNKPLFDSIVRIKFINYEKIHNLKYFKNKNLIN